VLPRKGHTLSFLPNLAEIPSLMGEDPFLLGPTAYFQGDLLFLGRVKVLLRDS